MAHYMRSTNCANCPTVPTEGIYTLHIFFEWVGVFGDQPIAGYTHYPTLPTSTLPTTLPYLASTWFQLGMLRNLVA